MVAHRHQIGVERVDLGLRGWLATQHPQDVGGVGQARVGRDRGFPGLAANHGGGEDGGRG